jgi:hypothetical protein
MSIEINGYILEQTCARCPEQYEVFKGGKQVAYLRLRHGEFSADMPDPGGNTVFEVCPHGDGWFEDYERQHYLEAAINEVDWRLKQLEEPPMP